MMCYEVHLPIGCMPFLAVMARRDGARPAYEISDPPVAWSARIGQECGGSAAWLSEARFATSDIFTPALLAQAAFRAQSMRGGGWTTSSRWGPGRPLPPGWPRAPLRRPDRAAVRKPRRRDDRDRNMEMVRPR